jgi:hypothetical protein
VGLDSRVLLASVGDAQRTRAFQPRIGRALSVGSASQRQVMRAGNQEFGDKTSPRHPERA